jgi:hypothetical protein
LFFVREVVGLSAVVAAESAGAAAEGDRGNLVFDRDLIAIVAGVAVGIVPAEGPDDITLPIIRYRSPNSLIKVMDQVVRMFQSNG